MPPAIEDVSYPSAAYRALREKWQLIADLLGGTQTMRLAGERWLPKEPKERQAKYEVRIQRSFLFNGFGDAVENIVARPFTRDIVVKPNLGGGLEVLIDDCDAMGTSLTRFGRELFRTGVAFGCGGVLVDYPHVPDGTVRNMAEENALGLRPYFVLYQPWQVLGYRVIQTAGAYLLDQVRLLEEQEEPFGEYGTQTVRRIRVYTRDRWELWKEEILLPQASLRRDTQWNVYRAKFVKEAEGFHPFGAVPFYSFRTRPWDRYYGVPPLEDLAWMNVAHWQSYSDQRGILRVARVPILGRYGWTEQDKANEGDGPIAVGPWNIVTSENPQAHMEFTEHSGAAIGAGRQDILDLEEKMHALGMRPLVQRTGDTTATEAGINEARSVSDVIDWVHGCEHTLTECIKAAYHWTGQEAPSDLEADINDDIAVRVDATDLQALQGARAIGEISRDAYLFELKRRNVLHEGFDAEADAEKLAEEAPLPAVPDDGGMDGETPEEKRARLKEMA